MIMFLLVVAALGFCFWFLYFVVFDVFRQADKAPSIAAAPLRWGMAGDDLVETEGEPAEWSALDELQLVRLLKRRGW